MVLKRMTLPVDQPPPQPVASSVKYGWPVAGLIGEQSAAVLPTAIRPTCSPITLNEVVLVNWIIQRSVTVPSFVTPIGASTSLNVPVAAEPMAESDQTFVHET